MSKKIISGKRLPEFFYESIEQNFSRFDFADVFFKKYMLDLLIDFTDAEKFYMVNNIVGGDNPNPVKFLNLAKIAQDCEIGKVFTEERKFDKYLGDFSLFGLGIFPENFKEVRLYSWIGKERYSKAAELYPADLSKTLRNMSSNFESCVSGLKDVRKEFKVEVDPYHLEIIWQK